MPKTPLTSSGAFGTVLGLVAASTFMPNGCSMNHEQSMHLRVGLPILFPVVSVALAYLVARTRAWKSVVVAVLGQLVIAVGASLLYGDIEATGAAVAVLAPVLLAGAVALPWAAWMTQVAAAARRDTPPERAYGAAPWPLLAGIAGAAAGAVLTMASTYPLDRRLATAGLGLEALLLLVGAHRLARMYRAKRELAAMPLPSSGARNVSDADLPDALDAGFGTQIVVLEQDTDGPFRSSPRVWLGDHRDTRRRLSRVASTMTAILLLGLLGWTLGVVGLRRSPEWRPPRPRQPISGGFGRC